MRDSSPVLLLGALICSGQFLVEAATPPINQRLHAAVEQVPIDGGFTGVVLIWSGETILLRRGYGLADREQGRPNSPKTQFEIASLSKHFIASLTFTLIQQGFLSEGTTIGEVFPESPRSNSQITVAQLAHHTSGLPSYTKWEGWPQLSREPIGTEVFASELLDQGLEFDPGTSFGYSNSGYYVLGVLLERVSGRPVSELLRERIFTPAGMADSYLMTENPSENSRRATGYERLEDGREFPVQPLVPSRSFAAGAIVSTADDLHRWSRWVQSGGLNPDVSEKLLTPGPGNYGGGLVIARADPRQIDRFLNSPSSYKSGNGDCLVSWHWGSNPGFNAMMLWIGQRTGLVLLENREDLALERSTHLFELTASLVEELAGTIQPCS